MTTYGGDVFCRRELFIPSSYATPGDNPALGITCYEHYSVGDAYGG